MFQRTLIALSIMAALAITGVGMRSSQTTVRGTVDSMLDPSGDLAVAFVPTPERGKLVRVTRITSESVKQGNATEVFIKQIGLENITNRNVIGVAVNWRVTYADRSKTIVEGQSRRLNFRFDPGRRVLINYPLLSLSEVMAQVHDKGQLRGSLFVEWSVDEVAFEDGSTWSRVGIISHASPASERVRSVALSSARRAGGTTLLQDEIIPVGGGGGDKPSNRACALVIRSGSWTCVSYSGANCTISGSICSD